MLVKVFIKRRFKEGKLKEIFTQLRKIRSEAMRREGYISGETLVEIDDPKKVMVVSIWQSMEEWLEWKIIFSLAVPDCPPTNHSESPA